MLLESLLTDTGIVFVIDSGMMYSLMNKILFADGLLDLC